MGDRSSIEWTDATWNPLAAFDRETGRRGWFCTKVSDGCTHCYAEVLNKRLGTGHLYRVPNLEKVEFRLVNLDQPARWKRPRRIFVNSMTDLFHEAVPFELIERVFHAMGEMAPHHTFQILTKRPERMREFAWRQVGAEPFPNIWLGTSVEHQAAAAKRIPELLATPAAVRFLSCEPLLGPIDLTDLVVDDGRPGEWHIDCLRCDVDERDDVPFYGATIQWVIIGGESGPRARPFSITGARAIVRDCQAAGVPVFVKQLGARPTSVAVRDPKGGDWSEWPEDLRVREFPR